MHTTDDLPSIPSKPQRLLSLDVFRGLTLVGMVFVNTHGSGNYMYPGVGHGKWNQWGFADLMLPFFIFIVGVAIPYALESRRARGATDTSLVLNILRRAIVLFAIGVAMNAYPERILGLFLDRYHQYDFSTLRIFAPLQRIAVCYLFASLIYLAFKPKGQVIIGAALLVGYFIMMKFVPVPGYGAGVFQPEGNWAQYIDFRVLHGRMQTPTWEGKGLLTTLPAIVMAMIGVLTGQYMRSAATPLEKTANLYLFGTLSTCLGAVWSISFPINQNMWTSSLTMFMGGMALIVLASCYYVVDIRKNTWWTPPFVVFGVNSILVWVGSMVMRQTLEAIQVTGSNGKLVDLKTYLFQGLSAWIGPWNGSLLFAVLFVLLWLAILSVLYRFKIFFKV